MDRLNLYRNSVKQIIERCYSIKSDNPNIQVNLIIDQERNHFIVMDIGWENEESRIYDVVMHLSIIENKIWIQKDVTDMNPAEELIQKGVPKEDIMIGFMPLYKRKYSEFTA